MQEKKNKRLLISLTVLIALIVVFYWRGSDSGAEKINKEIFLVEDYQTIDKVVLESGSEKTELKFNGTRWKVNEKLDADRNMISVLFATLQQARPKRKVSSQIEDSLKTQAKNHGVKVSLFAGQSLEKTFYAGGNANKTQAYFVDPESDEIYIMEIPGYRVYVSGILELDENGWRDKYVFNFNWQNFSGLEVRFPDKSAENFNVFVTKERFGIEGMEADTSKLSNFLDAVAFLTADRFGNDDVLADSLTKAKPVMEIIVKDIANRNYNLKVFRPGTTEVTALVPENQLAFFNPRKIQPIIRPKSFFRKR